MIDLLEELRIFKVVFFVISNRRFRFRTPVHGSYVIVKLGTKILDVFTEISIVYRYNLPKLISPSSIFYDTIRYQIL